MHHNDACSTVLGHFTLSMTKMAFVNKAYRVQQLFLVFVVEYLSTTSICVTTDILKSIIVGNKLIMFSKMLSIRKNDIFADNMTGISIYKN